MDMWASAPTNQRNTLCFHHNYSLFIKNAKPLKAIFIER